MWKLVVLALALYVTAPANATDTPKFVRLNKNEVVCQGEAALQAYLTGSLEAPAQVNTDSLPAPECRWLENNTVFAVLDISFFSLDTELVVIGQLYLWPKGNGANVFAVVGRGSLDQFEEI